MANARAKKAAKKMIRISWVVELTVPASMSEKKREKLTDEVMDNIDTWVLNPTNELPEGCFMDCNSPDEEEITE